MARRIANLLPPHTVYVEPFVGGGAVLFAKGHPEATNSHHYREVINDHDESLIALYRALQKDKKLLHKLEQTPYARSEHAKAKKLKTPWAKFVRLAMSFANVEHGGWGTGVFGVNSASTWHRRVSELWATVERLRAVHIECDDALAVIERWDSPQTCFYLDPPYPGTNQGDYAGYTTKNFHDLVHTLKHARGSFVLSNYDQPGVPKRWKRHEISAHCTASRQGKAGKGRDKSKKATKAEIGNRKRTEVLWVVDRSKNTRKELRNVLWSPSQGYAYRTQGTLI